MCWLAATGRLKDELERFGIASGRAPASLAAAATQPTQSGWIAACNLAVVLASLAGLLAALGDFDDLFEAAVALDFPFLQLGMPVVVFAMALFAACSSIPARRPSTAAERRCGGCASTQQDSMRRASAILFGLGFGGFGAAELAEHGASFPISLFLAGMALTTRGIGGSLVHPGRR
jgi:hypothetical protein